MVSKKHVSVQRGDATQAKIDLKFELLRDWIANGIPWKLDLAGNHVFDKRGEKVLVDIPRDIKSFGIWEGRYPWSRARRASR